MGTIIEMIKMIKVIKIIILEWGGAVARPRDENFLREKRGALGKSVLCNDQASRRQFCLQAVPGAQGLGRPVPLLGQLAPAVQIVGSKEPRGQKVPTGHSAEQRGEDKAGVLP